MRFTRSIALGLAAAAVASAPGGAHAAPVPLAAETGSVTMTITGLEIPQGRVMLALYDSKAAYEGGSPVRVTPIAISATQDVSRVIERLAPGAYAIKAFHDVDGDGKVGKNPFGIPTEPFAFSNDAKGDRGPASWEAAAFTIAAGANSQRITIR